MSILIASANNNKHNNNSDNTDNDNTNNNNYIFRLLGTKRKRNQRH